MSTQSQAAYDALKNSTSLKYGDYDVTKDWKYISNPLSGMGGAGLLAFNPNNPTQKFNIQNSNSASALQLQDYLSMHGGDLGDYKKLGQYFTDPSLQGSRKAFEGLFAEPSLESIAEGKRSQELAAAVSAGKISREEATRQINTPPSTQKTLYQNVYDSTPTATKHNWAESIIPTGDNTVNSVHNNSGFVQNAVPTFTLTGGNLRQGSNGTNVQQLQNLLGVSADGIFGPKTQAAVIAFQKANGLTPDGIVGPNTTALLNKKYGNGSAGNLGLPNLGGVGSGVPNVGNSPNLPSQNSGTANEVYYQSMVQQVQTLQQTLDAEYQRQLLNIQQDKQNAQDELNTIRSNESNAISSEGKITAQEKQDKLDQLSIEQKRFDENYKIVQGLGSQLMDLMTQGNALIASQKGVTGLGLIRNPRVNETINNITAAAGVIQAGISVYNGQMNQAQNQLQTATAAITSAYSDQIDYYKALSNFYESEATDQSNKLTALTSTEQDFLRTKIALLENDAKRVKDNADAIQRAMIDPDTALAYASSGVTLNDTPQVINQKLAKYAYSKELASQSSDMAEKGFTALIGGTAPAGSQVVRITDTKGQVKTYYKKATANSETAKPLSILDIQRYQELYPNAGIVAGDTEATANSKVKASNSPEAQATAIIQTAKDGGASYESVVKELGDDQMSLSIAKQIYGKTSTTSDIVKDKYTPVGDTISAPTGNERPEGDWDNGFINGIFNTLFK